MLNFSPGAKRKFSWERLLRCENTVDADARVHFSARDEKNYPDYMVFFSQFGQAENLGRWENTGLGLLAPAELRPGLNPPPCNRQFVSEAGLKFQPGMKFAMWSSPTRGRIWQLLKCTWLHNESENKQPVDYQSQLHSEWTGGIKVDLIMLKVYALLMRDVLPTRAKNSANDQDSVQEFLKWSERITVEFVTEKATFSTFD